MVTKPLFKDVSLWLNKMCILPYTEDELDCLGCLGFDMKHYKDFGEKYMEKLLERYDPDNAKVPFSELNIQLYREVLELPDLEKIPTWIRMPDPNTQQNPIKARIAQMHIRQKTTPRQEEYLKGMITRRDDFTK